MVFLPHKVPQKGKFKMIIRLFPVLLLTFTLISSYADEEHIVAKVNGEAIYESELSDGLNNSNELIFASWKEAKLKRITSERLIRQLLTKKGIAVSSEEIDKAVEDFSKNPPSQGCACCSYPSMEKFLESNGYSMDEFRVEIWNMLGVKKYQDFVWDSGYSPEKKSELVKKKTEEMKKIYVKVSHIFFNTFQDPDFQGNPDYVINKKRKLCEAAKKRLDAGENFEKLAGDLSEDKTTKDKGGMLGVMPRSLFGKESVDAVAVLKAGETSRVAESYWGFHIFKVWDLETADVIAIIREELVARDWEKEKNAFIKNSVIEKTP